MASVVKVLQEMVKDESVTISVVSTALNNVENSVTSFVKLVVKDSVEQREEQKAAQTVEDKKKGEARPDLTVTDTSCK